jgi:hypothetical protein
MFGVKFGGGKDGRASAAAGTSLGVSLPSVATCETVTLRSNDGAGFGFDICADTSGGIAVQSIHSSGPAKESGLIQPGDRISGINIDMENMALVDAEKLLACLSSYPLKLNVRKQASGSAAVEGSAKGPDVHLPAVGIFGKPNADIGLAATGPKVRGPSLDVGGKVESPHADTPDLDFKHGVSGPHINVKGPTVDVTGGGSVKTAHGNAPSVGVEGVAKGASFNMPDFSIAGASKIPQVDVPSVGFEGSATGITGPNIRGSVEGPHSDVGISGNLHGPGIGLAESAKHAQVDIASAGPGGKMSGDTNLPCLPNVGVTGSISSPSVTADVRPADVNIKLPQKFDIEVPGTSVGGDVSFSGVDVTPSAVDVHTKGPSFGGKLRGLFRSSSGKKEKKNKNARASLEGDLSLHPGSDIKAGLPSSRAEVDIPEATGDVGLGADKIDIKIPTTGTGVNIDSNLPSVGGDINGGRLSVEGELPEVCIQPDVKAKAGKHKGEKEGGFKMHFPKFGFGKSGKYSIADASIETTPDVQLQADKSHKGDIAAGITPKGPKIDVDLEKPELEGKAGGKLDIKIPKLGFGESGKPHEEINASLPSHGLSGDLDIHPPAAEVSGEVGIKGPKVDVDGEKPDLKGKGGVGLDIHLPKFGFGANGKAKGDIDARLPSGDVDIHPPGADISGGVNIKAPKLNVDVEKPELKGKGGGGLDIHLPKFGFGGSGKGRGDIDASRPSADVDVHPPGADISGDLNVKAPKVNVDVEKPELKGKGGGGLDIHMPKFGFGGSG